MNYRDPRHLLILVGCICQGYSWENSIVPLIYASLWFLAVKRQRQTPLISQDVEALVLLISFAFFKMMWVGYSFGHNQLIFLGGNLLFAYQIIHLLEPPRLRQKKISVLVAVMHIGVGTQVIFDYKAAIILLAALVLVPKSLYALASDRFTPAQTHDVTPLNPRNYVFLAIMTILFFLIFPRFGFQNRATGQLFGVPGPLTRDLDTSSSGTGSGDDRLIMRVEAEGLGYMKSYALDQFDGNHWTASNWLKKWKRSWRNDWPIEQNHRSVRILNFQWLRNTLPVDGTVQNITGPFLDRPYISGDDGVKVSFNLRQNISYQYWTTWGADVHPLEPRELDRYTKLPHQSPRLRQWLDSRVGTGDDPETIAMKLVTHFQSEFEYKLGGPDLNRINPIDEFILDRQEGHCERFASALAVLLRMKQIPARVCVGFLPAEKNELGGFYNIRGKHAHAWTEAYLEGQGWMIVDGTPYGRGVELESRAFAFTIYEWLEYMWYAKIVEFGVTEQRAIFGLVTTGVRTLLARTLKFGLPALCGIVVVGILLLLSSSNFKRFYLSLLSPENRRTAGEKEAKHFYGRMLKALARQRIARHSYQTPNEFLSSLELKRHPSINEIRFVTQSFCRTRYGGNALTADDYEKLRAALTKIVKSRR